MQRPVHKLQARYLRTMGSLEDMGRSTPPQVVCGTVKFLTVGFPREESTHEHVG